MDVNARFAAAYYTPNARETIQPRGDSLRTRAAPEGQIIEGQARREPSPPPRPLTETEASDTRQRSRRAREDEDRLEDSAAARGRLSREDVASLSGQRNTVVDAQRNPATRTFLEIASPRPEFRLIDTYV